MAVTRSVQRNVLRCLSGSGRGSAMEWTSDV